MKTIKIILFIGLFTLFIFSCKAQTIIPVEEFHSYGKGLKGGDYIKDINGVLDKYVGVWQGTHNNHNFLFNIKKTTLHKYGFFEDLLLIRYRITDAQGNEIINTLSLPDESIYVIEGIKMDEVGDYRLFYQGYESDCGQCGEIIIHAFMDSNPNKLLLILIPMRDMIDPTDCPNGTTQLLPTEPGITFTKQKVSLQPIK